MTEPTPEMIDAGLALSLLIRPVTAQLLDLGVDPHKAGFAAYDAVVGVLKRLHACNLDVEHILKNRKF